MILTPVSIMRILFCRKLGEYQKPRKIIVKKQRNMHNQFFCPYNIELNGFVLIFYLFFANVPSEMPVFSPAVVKLYVLRWA